MIAPELAHDEEFRARFLRETQLAASLEHPNVIPIYDAGEVDGVLYLAMRYVAGPSLRTLLRERSALSVEQTLAIARQIGDALDAAHAAGLVHRDVKPANVLLSETDERVFLCDFGLARRSDSEGLTQTGSFLGTVDYAAPEQIEGRPVDGRADVYSLGCVLFHCLAGRAPYVGDTEYAVLHAHVSEGAPLVSSERADAAAGSRRRVAEGAGEGTGRALPDRGRPRRRVRSRAGGHACGSGGHSAGGHDRGPPAAAAPTLGRGRSCRSRRPRGSGSARRGSRDARLGARRSAPRGLAQSHGPRDRAHPARVGRRASKRGPRPRRRLPLPDQRQRGKQPPERRGDEPPTGAERPGKDRHAARRGDAGRHAARDSPAPLDPGRRRLRQRLWLYGARALSTDEQLLHRRRAGGPAGDTAKVRFVAAFNPLAMRFGRRTWTAAAI